MGRKGAALGRKVMVLVAVAGLWATAADTYKASAWDSSPLNHAITAQNHLCGASDLPETGIQGDVPKADQASGRAKKGYNCGLALVGHVALNLSGRPNANANMAWAGHCAYVAGSGGAPIVPQSKPKPPAGAGIAVVDVSNSAHPKQVANLRDPGDLTTAETLNAVTTPTGRSILVVGQYGNDIVSSPKPMDVYDVSNPDCSKFKHMTTYYWPANIHNLTLSPDGRYVFATIPLQAADIGGLWAPRPTGVKYLGNINNAMTGLPLAVGPLDDVLPPAAGSLTHPVMSSHEAWLSADGHTLYAGGQTVTGETLTIVDINEWLKRDSNGKPLGPPKVLSQTSGRGHSIRTATINGIPYLLHSEESVFGAAYSCIPQEANPFAGPAQPWLTNIKDPTHPVLLSQMGLEINDLKNCVAQLSSGVNDSVHYHDVDNPKDTTFVMASMWNAGIRLFDVRDPKKPTEVAYFNPGDIDPSGAVRIDHAWGHIHYDPVKGEIWFATADGGLWVVRIEGKVRNYLNLDHKVQQQGLRPLNLPVDDRGHAGTAGATLLRPLGGYVDISPYYCTLAPLLAPIAVAGR